MITIPGIGIVFGVVLGSSPTEIHLILTRRREQNTIGRKAAGKARIVDARSEERRVAARCHIVGDDEGGGGPGLQQDIFLGLKGNLGAAGGLKDGAGTGAECGPDKVKNEQET
jgi:hypothetical protein